MLDHKHIIIDIRTSEKAQLLEVTKEVQKQVLSKKFSKGVCSLFIPHTTAGVTINENADADVRTDILKGFEEIVKNDIGYMHAEGNSPAHIKSTIVGISQDIFVETGKLVLGTWQGIFFCEFDGPRTRKMHIILKGWFDNE